MTQTDNKVHYNEWVHLKSIASIIRNVRIPFSKGFVSLFPKKKIGESNHQDPSSSPFPWETIKLVLIFEFPLGRFVY